MTLLRAVRAYGYDALPWIRSIALNVLRNFLRDQATKSRCPPSQDRALEAAIYLSSDASGAESPLTQLLEVERLDALRLALEDLPPQMRTTVQLRLRGLSFAEISELVGTSSNTAKSQVSKAVPRLRAWVRGHRIACQRRRPDRVPATDATPKAIAIWRERAQANPPTPWSGPAIAQDLGPGSRTEGAVVSFPQPAHGCTRGFPHVLPSQLRPSPSPSRPPRRPACPDGRRTTSRSPTYRRLNVEAVSTERSKSQGRLEPRPDWAWKLYLSVEVLPDRQSSSGSHEALSQSF